MIRQGISYKTNENYKKANNKSMTIFSFWLSTDKVITIKFVECERYVVICRGSQCTVYNTTVKVTTPGEYLQ